ncbi:hypothetical protein [Paenibacillus radicis (ex Gao et al. 2016)]|uniref:Uncharacterized protein n=1 Tax=Paenibacillus radicis (ex Gao et al. 2016) TaxID=1737354 RepID=A0A917M9J9_9BACL|nr:hypothetical protein [Paenibacillus radicis (ex Gao et al. 2016)]GGG86125.1 hypothetical protein GCM10010918_50340 [Paenibacillus radicis (ex Gao et al. 2016)]
MSSQRRAFLNLSYTLLGLWLLIVVLSKSYVLFAVLLSLPDLLLTVCLMGMGIYLLFAARGWKWEERIVSIILVLPFIWLFIWPVVHDEIQLYRTVPTDEIVKRFVEYKYVGSTEVLDTSLPMADYDSASKNLKLFFKVQPDIFVPNEERVHGSFKDDPVSSAQIFMRVLYINLIDQPKELTEVTKVPKTIEEYGYWGDTLILKANYKKSKGEYKLIPPYPDVSLVSANGMWYLKYTVEGKEGEIYIADVPGVNIHNKLISNPELP